MKTNNNSFAQDSYITCILINYEIIALHANHFVYKDWKSGTFSKRKVCTLPENNGSASHTLTVK